MTAPVDVETREYRIKGVYRRMVYYGIGGVVAVLALVAWLRDFLQLPGFPRMLLFPLGFGLLATTPCWLLWLLAFRWRFHVDRHWLTFRCLTRTYFWPWDAFRDGSVQRLDGGCDYFWPEGPRGGRILPLLMMDFDDRNELLDLCDRIWVPPPLEPLPEEVELTVLRSKVRLTRRGLQVDNDGEVRSYDWADVVKLTIVRPGRGRDDFREAILELPGRTIEFKRKPRINRSAWPGDSPHWAWRGASSSTVGRFLLQQIPEERTYLVTLGEEPQSVDEVEWYLKKFRSMRRGVWRYWLILPAMGASWLMGDIRLSVALILFLLPLCVFFLWRDRDRAQEQKEYLAKRERLVADAMSVLGPGRPDAGDGDGVT